MVILFDLNGKTYYLDSQCSTPIFWICSGPSRSLRLILKGTCLIVRNSHIQRFCAAFLRVCKPLGDLWMAPSLTLLTFQVDYFVFFSFEANKRVGRHLHVVIIHQLKTVLSKNVQVHPKAQGAFQWIQEREKKSFFIYKLKKELR